MTEGHPLKLLQTQPAGRVRVMCPWVHLIPLSLGQKNENAFGIHELDLLQELFDGSGTLGPFPSPWDFGERLQLLGFTFIFLASGFRQGVPLQHPSSVSLRPTSGQGFFCFSSLFPLRKMRGALWSLVGKLEKFGCGGTCSTRCPHLEKAG